MAKSQDGLGNQGLRRKDTSCDECCGAHQGPEQGGRGTGARARGSQGHQERQTGDLKPGARERGWSQCPEAISAETRGSRARGPERKRGTEKLGWGRAERPRDPD